MASISPCSTRKKHPWNECRSIRPRRGREVVKPETRPRRCARAVHGDPQTRGLASQRNLDRAPGAEGRRQKGRRHQRRDMGRADNPADDELSDSERRQNQSDHHQKVTSLGHAVLVDPRRDGDQEGDRRSRQSRRKGTPQNPRERSPLSARSSGRGTRRCRPRSSTRARASR